MFIFKLIGKMLYLLVVIMLYMAAFPLWLVGKLLFWWLPTESDGNDAWHFWKHHGHEW